MASRAEGTASVGGVRAPKSAVGVASLVAYVATVVLANWFIQHVGSLQFPGGPHTIPVGFGYRAPSGVLWIGLALVLRDVVQRHLGKSWTLGGIAVAAALSYVVAPSLAWASACAFAVSELLDFAVYTPLRAKGRVVAAVVASNTVGLLIDTFLFLWLAFGSIDFWQGQVIGKAWMTVLAAVALLALDERRREAVA